MVRCFNDFSRRHRFIFFTMNGIIIYFQMCKFFLVRVWRRIF